ncbi:protein kinase [Mycobacterium intermedium]|uniref:serine/threonine-protein kinase PknD n=1 Tax=Mycobacterium intermedium TaxID=28445 RepID=UPI000A5AE989|nr:serine/threonine-protein kinase PknD [Mycobacterium intermedium]MCV6966509.1 protein kinase [Mycobacterium intermedium]
MATEAMGEVFGRYRLLETLQWGCTGTVYRAYDTEMKREAALRVLPAESTNDPGRYEQLREEVASAARLSNPHIIPIYDVGDIDGRLYVAMPNVDGVDLKSLLGRDGPMSPRSAVRVIEQAAAALEAAHNGGLVHGDVKPSNLFVACGEFVYFLDVGVEARTRALSASAADVAIGDWPYLAPERFDGGAVEPSSDIYALACVLYECLTGRQAVDGDSLEQFVNAHSQGEPPKPTEIVPAIPTGFDEVIARGMARKPEDRYQTVRDLSIAARDALASPVAAPPEPATEVEFGRYRLFEMLGQGSMGSVYRAYDTALDRDVAVKLLRPEMATEPGYVERFRREAFAAGRLANPNIVPIYDAGEIDGRLYLVMPIVDGTDVHTVLRRDGQMSPHRAVRVIEQAAAALDAAHKSGLVHRDVKPSNLLMVGEEFVYLIDFGLVQEATGTRLTRTNVNPGTPAYMAPERFKLEHIADARGDVYSLACVLYECLTGRPPFAGGGVEGLAAAHLFNPPPKPCSIDPAIPIGFDDVIARGMAKDIDARYQTASELAAAARAALDTVPGTAVTPPPASDPSPSTQAAPPTVPPPSPRRRRRVYAIAAAAIVVAAVAAFVGLTSTDSKQRAQVVLPFTGLSAPAGLAVDAKGDVYVVDAGNNRVLKLAVGSTNQIVEPFGGLETPEDIAVDDAGDVVITEPSRRRVQELTAGSNSPIVLPFTGLGEPTGVAFLSQDSRADGSVIVTDATYNRVVSLRLQPTEQTDLPFSGLDGPSAVAVDGDGAVIVIDRQNERVLKLPQTATEATVLPYVIGRPDYVAVDTEGNVYVTDTRGNRVLQLIKESSSVITLPFNGLNDPHDVAVDAAGNVYVADAGNNRVLKLPRR